MFCYSSIVLHILNVGGVKILLYKIFTHILVYCKNLVLIPTVQETTIGQTAA